MKLEDGVFTTMRLHEGRIEYLDMHLSRLKNHCVQLKIAPPPLDAPYFLDFCKKHNLMEGTWRFKVIVEVSGKLTIVYESYKKNLPEALRLTLYRTDPDLVDSHIKRLNNSSRGFLRQKAFEEGFDDCITEDQQGNLLEASFANIFYKNGNTVYTPDPNLPLLSGIMLGAVENAVKNLGFHFRKAFIRFDSIPLNSQVFICNSLILFHPVISLNNRIFSRDKEFEQNLYQHIFINHF